MARRLIFAYGDVPIDREDPEGPTQNVVISDVVLLDDAKMIDLANGQKRADQIVPGDVYRWPHSAMGTSVVLEVE